MQYSGGKHRYGRSIAAHIMAHMNKHNLSIYIEPMVGSGAVIRHIRQTYRRIAGDINPYAIALLSAVEKGWEPPEEVTEEEYYYIRDHKEQFPDQLVGFVGFACSWGGKWFGGYARSSNRNYAKNGRNSLLKIAPMLRGIMWYVGDYTVIVSQGALVYFDPPYRGVTSGYIRQHFDHAHFYAWVDFLAKRNNHIFLTEFYVPDGFEIIDTFNRAVHGRKVRVEYLLYYGGV